VTPEAAKAAVRRSNTIIASLMVKLGDADAMLCGLVGRYDVHLEHIRDIIGLRARRPNYATLNALMLDRTHAVHRRHLRQRRPQRRAAGRHRLMAAEEVQRFGLPPQGGLPVALESTARPSAPESRRSSKMRLLARDLFVRWRADPTSNATARCTATPRCREDIRNALHGRPRSGAANLLVCPNLDAANILFNVLKMTAARASRWARSCWARPPGAHPDPRRPRCAAWST
jgi:malate dehydrogenase (oxaloacetate-decarboxylating)(NADP+)